jgi:hypothetical protein
MSRESTSFLGISAVNHDNAAALVIQHSACGGLIN